MPIVFLDDGYHSNRKIIRAGLAGAGLYSRALSLCGDELTDGWVPREWADEVGNEDLNARLERVGLWIKVAGSETFRVKKRMRSGDRPVTVTIPDEGYFIPDYLAFNPSRREVEIRRAERARSASHAARHRWAHADGDAKPDAFADADPHAKPDASEMPRARTDAPAALDPRPEPIDQDHDQEPAGRQAVAQDPARELDDDRGLPAGSDSEHDDPEPTLEGPDSQLGAIGSQAKAELERLRRKGAHA